VNWEEYVKKEKLLDIKQKYPGEWILVADYITDDLAEPLEGVVVAHSKNRAKIYTRQIRSKTRICIEYAGEIPEDLVVIF
jgi:hypothetical protein